MREKLRNSCSYKLINTLPFSRALQSYLFVHFSTNTDIKSTTKWRIRVFPELSACIQIIINSFFEGGAQCYYCFSLISNKVPNK